MHRLLDPRGTKKTGETRDFSAQDPVNISIVTANLIPLLHQGLFKVAPSVCSYVTTQAFAMCR